MSVAVVATIAPAAGHEATVLDALRRAVASVTTDEAATCERYELHVDPQGTYWMIERWRDEPALDQHASGPAFTQLLARLDGILSRPISVHRMTPV